MFKSNKHLVDEIITRLLMIFFHPKAKFMHILVKK